MQFVKYSLFASFLLLFLTTSVSAGAPDGSGPWADEVVSSNQTTTKDGQLVSLVNPLRSDPTTALGEAEYTNADGYFFSLGFGGSITLKFDNPFSNGVLVVESTYDNYPLEKAKVEVSSDGSNWFEAGQVVQDGTVTQPEGVSCAAYVRITDISSTDDFQEGTADGYDVDGVKVEGETACEINQETEPTPTPSPSPTPTPTTTNDGGSEDTSATDDNSCRASKPETPTLTASRTSSTTAELSWNSVKDASHYAISYGLTPGNYIYGVANTGKTTSFSVGGLDPNSSYYFVVTAINDCMPGERSNEVSVSNVQVLGISASQSGEGDSVLGLTTELASTGSIAYLLKGISTLLLATMAFGIGFYSLSREQ